MNYYASFIIKDEADNTWQCSCNEADQSIQKAIERVRWYRENYPTVLIAWIDDGFSNIKWIKNYQLEKEQEERNAKQKKHST